MSSIIKNIQYDYSYIKDICTRPWETAVEPVQVAPHVYYAGNKWVGVFWVDTTKGLILFDSGMPFQLYIVFEGMRKLGFNPKDIKLVLSSHAHYDHCGALKAVLEYTGAYCYASEKDKNALATGEGVLNGPFDYQGVTPDFLYEKNNVITLGNIIIRAIVNGGHTPGTTCFFFNDKDTDGKIYKIGIHGGLGFNLLSNEYLGSKEKGEEARNNYIAAQEMVKNEAIDIALSFHPYNVNMLEKLSTNKSWKILVDEKEWQRMIESRITNLKATYNMENS